MTVDGVGNIYILDAKSLRLTKFDPAGRPLLGIELGGRAPRGLALDSGGAIYVSYADPPAIEIYLPNGEFFRRIGRGIFSLSRPSAMTVDAAGHLLVFDAKSHTLRQFSPEGTFLRELKPAEPDAARLEHPVHLAVTPFEAGSADVYAADGAGGRIQKFGLEGELLASWELVGHPAAKMEALAGLAVSPQYVFTADAANRRVHVWGQDGAWLRALDVAPWIPIPAAGEPSMDALAWRPARPDISARARRADNVAAPAAAPGMAANPGELLVLRRAERRILRFRLHL